MKKNNKGFTLIELLAVIVILAVLILVAMPAVTTLMERSRKGAFVTEAEQFAKGLQTAYTDSLISGTFTNSGTKSKATSSDGKYTYFCMSVAELMKGYVDKSGTGYSGIVEAFIPTSTGDSNAKAVYIVSMTNGQYVSNAVSLTMLGNNSYAEGNGLGQVGGGTTVNNTTCKTTNADVTTQITAYTNASVFS